MGNTRIRTGFRAATAVAALALPLTMAGTAFADQGGNVPGDNGTVKIHNTGTPQDDRENQPQVCTFYLDASGFDTLQKVHWEIDVWSPSDEPKGTGAAAGDIALTDGSGATAEIPLPDGHYKLFWTFEGEHGAAKHKVFWVRCEKPTSPSSTPTSSSSSSPSSPSQPSSPSGSTGGSTGGTSGGTTGGGTGGSTGGTTSTVQPTATSPATAPSTSSTGGLAHTGADGSVLFMAAGAIALGGGGFALRRYAVARTKA
ncbi:MAG: LPXTG cell wall anchor domain-containing protein [Catenulispora sp.]|nr:LPXTG cell wall anchor domain-containing protein [Catenulispora sp.]